MKALALVLLSLALADPPEKTRTPRAEDPPPANSVEGLELPADQTVPGDEGFVTVPAKTEATEIRWIVFGSGKVKFVELDRQVIISIPPEGGVITVFAVGLVKDHLTPAARMVITVRGAQPPPESAREARGPAPPVTGKLHITLVLDYARTPPALTAVVNSAGLRKAIADGGDVLRVYPSTSPVLASQHLDTFITKAGGVPCVIIQTDEGRVLTAERLPTSPEGIQAVIRKVKGG